MQEFAYNWVQFLPRPTGTENDPGGILGWLYDNHKSAYAVLWLMDKAVDGLLFHDPNHTISYHVALMAREGNPFGAACCALLNLLSPNHCAWALENNEEHCRVFRR